MNDLAGNLFEQHANVLLHLRPKTLTHEQKVQAAIEHIAQAQFTIQSLMLESPDNRSHLAEAGDMTGAALVDLRAYLKDCRAGLESEATHEDCCQCQKCLDERYPSGTLL